MERYWVSNNVLLNLSDQLGEALPSDKFTPMVKAADAQATIAALQAERDTARRRVDELEAREVDVVMLREDLEQRTAELARVRKKLGETKLYLQQERANRDSLVACVNRDVKTIKELRTLILALPKVEG